MFALSQERHPPIPARFAPTLASSNEIALADDADGPPSFVDDRNRADIVIQ